MTPDEILHEIARRDIHTRSTPFPAHRFVVWADGKPYMVCVDEASLERTIIELIGCSVEDHHAAKLDYLGKMRDSFSVPRDIKAPSIATYSGKIRVTAYGKETP